MLIVLLKDYRYNGSVITAGTELELSTLHEFIKTRMLRDGSANPPVPIYKELR